MICKYSKILLVGSVVTVISSLGGCAPKFQGEYSDPQKVEIVDDKKVIVWLAQDQRSYAIGKMGQNILLASRLVGLDIQLQDVSPSSSTDFFSGDVRLEDDSADDISLHDNE